MKARERYNQLTSGRSMFLDSAVECSRLTLPYLIQEDFKHKTAHLKLPQPWQA